MPADRNLTVCHLLLTLNMGGAEVLAARLARKLSHRHRFVFICLDELGAIGEQLSRDGFPVHVVGRRPGVDLRCARRLGQMVRGTGADLIHCHQYAPFFYGSLSRLGFNRPPVVFTEHGRNQPDYPKRRRIVANRFLLRRSDRVIGVGRAVCQALVQNEGIPEGRVELVYNGIEVNGFDASSCQRAAVRNELHLAADDFVMILVARLHWLKDHATALNALSHAVQRKPNIKLVLVGDGPEAEKISGLIHQLSLQSHVRSLGWRNDTGRLYNAADLALLTSVSEGIPLTLIEGMNLGLPVLATDVGGVSEVVEEAKTGLMVAAGDDQALAEKMVLLAENEPLRRQMGERGKQRAATLFSESRMLDEYSAIYEDLGQRGSSRAALTRRN